jgi:hypothetical protein
LTNEKLALADSLAHSGMILNAQLGGDGQILVVI